MHAVIHAAFPDRVTEKIETARVAPLQVRFGVAITFLLPQVGANGRTAMMPHNSTRVINDLLFRDEQAPAKINIVTGSAVLRVEETHCIEGFFAEGHVAAGNML